MLAAPLLLLTAAAAYRPAFTLDHITQVRTLGQFAISPDGTRVAYTLSGYYFAFAVVPRFGEDNNIRVVTLKNGEITQLTSGPVPKTRPVFSRSGEWVAFESEDDVWVAGLGTGSVRRVTTNGASDSSPSFAPDGARIAFVSDRGGRRDLWIASAEGERHGLQRLTDDPASEEDPQWSPDGATIAYAASRSDEHYYAQGIYAVPAAGGAPRRLTPKDASDNQAPRWSPDGRRIAFLSDRSGYVHVFTMDPQGDGAREFDTGKHDSAAAYWPVAPAWSLDGKQIMVSLNRESSFDLALLSAADGKVSTIAGGGGQYHEVGFGPGGALVYVHESAWSPPNLYVNGTDGATRRLTHSAHASFRRDAAAESKRVSFRSGDGLQLHGTLLQPRGLPRGERLPAILALHPNSYGQFTDGWNPFFDYLAQSGYVLLFADQRGSSGYGRAFRDAAIGAWGTKTQDDVQAMAAFLRAQPFVDPQRVGVMGLSFGGYQTLLALTKTPGLFQAGIDLMGPTDRRPPFANRNGTFHIGASPEQDQALYDRVSPITSVKDLSAPLLVLHSDRDRNVAPQQTYNLIDELERQAKPFEAHVYPGEAHGLADPANQLDSYRRITAFFGRWLRGRDAGTPGGNKMEETRP